MANSSIYSPSLLWLSLVLLSSCASTPEYYHRTLNPEEKASYARLFQHGIGLYYQGSSCWKNPGPWIRCRQMCGESWGFLI